MKSPHVSREITILSGVRGAVVTAMLALVLGCTYRESKRAMVAGSLLSLAGGGLLVTAAYREDPPPPSFGDPQLLAVYRSDLEAVGITSLTLGVLLLVVGVAELQNHDAAK